MGKRNFNSLVARTTRPLIKKVYENRLLSIVFIFATFIFVFPLVEYLQTIVKNTRWDIPIFKLVSFVLSVDLKDKLYISFAIATTFSIYKIWNKIANIRILKENFEKGFNNWNIPLGSKWTIQKYYDSKKRFVKVTDSNYPGVLKEIYGWFDYEVCFSAKMHKNTDDKLQNFTFVVRAENSTNCVMFQVTPTRIRPHYLYNGTYIVDDKNEYTLSLSLTPGSWVKVLVKVEGDDVYINIKDNHFHYRIINKSLNVDNYLFLRTNNLSDYETSNKQVEENVKKFFDQYEIIIKIKDEVERDKSLRELNDNYPKSTKVVLEYPKGSVGFRESGNECAYFRDLIIKKL